MSNTITVRVNDIEESILDQAAAVNGIGKSSLLKKLAFEKLEDEYDLKKIEEYEAKKKDGILKTRPAENLWEELGI